MYLKQHRIRELAMQILFLWDSHGHNDPDMARQLTHETSNDPIFRQRAMDMATAAWDARQVADSWVERLAPEWPPHRQPGIDRALLRLAIWELTAGQTDPRIILDEAIELAKHFSTQHSSRFINGVLDSVLREHLALTSAPSGADQTPSPTLPRSTGGGGDEAAPPAAAADPTPPSQQQE